MIYYTHCIQFYQTVILNDFFLLFCCNFTFLCGLLCYIFNCVMMFMRLKSVSTLWLYFPFWFVELNWEKSIQSLFWGGVCHLQKSIETRLSFILLDAHFSCDFWFNVLFVFCNFNPANIFLMTLYHNIDVVIVFFPKWELYKYMIKLLFVD